VNAYFLIAAVMATILTVGHSYFGEALFLKGVKPKLVGSYWGDGDITWRLVMGGWHLLSVCLGINAYCLYMLAFTANPFNAPRELLQLIIWQYTGMTIIVAYYAFRRPFILVRAPLWVLTGGVAFFSWLGRAAL